MLSTAVKTVCRNSDLAEHDVSKCAPWMLGASLPMGRAPSIFVARGHVRHQNDRTSLCFHTGGETAVIAGMHTRSIAKSGLFGHLRYVICNYAGCYLCETISHNLTLKAEVRAVVLVPHMTARDEN